MHFQKLHSSRQNPQNAYLLFPLVAKANLRHLNPRSAPMIHLDSANGTPPLFPRYPGLRGETVIVLSGPAIYMRSTKRNDSHPGVCDIELEVPSHFIRFGVELSRICVFSSGRDELIDVVPLGTRRNRVTVFTGYHESLRLGQAFCSLHVGEIELRFRCKEEAELWRVCIEDVMSCSERRWTDLTSPSMEDAPKGYRGHLQRLVVILSQKAALTEPKPSASGVDKQLFSRSLECIDTLLRRLKDCSCVKAVDMDSQDLVYETRQALIRLISLAP